MFKSEEKNKTESTKKVQELKPEGGKEFEISVSNIHTIPRKFLPGGGAKQVKKKSGGAKLWIVWVVVVVVIGGLVGVAAYFLARGPAELPANTNLSNVNLNSPANFNQNTNSGRLTSNTNLNTNSSNTNVPVVNVNSNTNNNVPINSNLNSNQNTNFNQNTNLNQNSNSNFNTNTNIPPVTVAPDSDGDGLTNVEEELYGTSPAQQDSDGDTFPDGTELVNLFNPLDSTGGKLEDSRLIKLFTNENLRFNVFYPAGWTLRIFDALSENVMFISQSGEFIQVIVQDNLSEITSPRGWYISQFPQVNQSQLTNVVVGGVTGVRAPDGLTVYFLKDGKVYVITYNIGTSSVLNYLTSFDMVVESFTFF